MTWIDISKLSVTALYDEVKTYITFSFSSQLAASSRLSLRGQTWWSLQGNRLSAQFVILQKYKSVLKVVNYLLYLQITFYYWSHPICHIKCFFVQLVCRGLSSVKQPYRLILADHRYICMHCICICLLISNKKCQRHVSDHLESLCPSHSLSTGERWRVQFYTVKRPVRRISRLSLV